MKKNDKKTDSVQKSNDEKYLETLVSSVIEDFNARRQERFNYEKQWQLNVNYLMGNQYAQITPTGEVLEEEKTYYWQSRSVYNHIAPIIETRLAKLSNIRPIMSVRASSPEDSDIKTAELSSEILNSAYQKLCLDEKINEACSWAENCGTAFYKIIWNNNGGSSYELDGEKVYEGEVDVSVIPPFEIFPDSLYRSKIEDCKSIIHARAVSVNDVEALYGVQLSGEEIDVFTLSNSGMSYNGGYKSKTVSSTVKNSVLVIERYEAPSINYPNGRVITVAGNKLLYLGELPYKNGVDGKRGFPFVRQITSVNNGCFFGTSVIERLIPVQRAFNAVKNRKHEFLNRLSMGVLAVEDGSVDIDELADDGLSPGKILVYRQGSKEPGLMSTGSVPVDFTYEEERLLSEFVQISATNEITRMAELYSHNLSGTAIELLNEQDVTRMSLTIDELKNAIKSVGKHILRLYKQFASERRIVKSAGGNKNVKLYYFNASDISSDDIVFDTETEISRSPAQKKATIMEMLSSGLLADKNGVITERAKSKILEALGYSSFDSVKDLTTLHRNRAEKENVDAYSGKIEVEEYDDHEIHIDEHTRALLTLSSENKALKTKLYEHIKIHKKYDSIAKNKTFLNGEQQV